MPDHYVVGVDLGGTKIYTALADKNGNILTEIKIPTEADGGLEHVIGRIINTVEQVWLQANVPQRPGFLGIGAPGPLDPLRGLIYQAPNLGWNNVPLKLLLENALDIHVAVENDANLAALGEYAYGAGRGTSEMIYVTVSTGIGGGLILRGKVYHGVGFGAGEIGHITIDPQGPLCRCGNQGCLEALASGTAIARDACQLVQAGHGEGILAQAGGNIDNITARVVSQAASAGDKEAQAILMGAGQALGIGLANIINLLNPGLVLLGGGVMQAGQVLWEAMEKEIDRRTLRTARRQVQVIPAALGGRSGLLGAIALALSISIQ